MNITISRAFCLAVLANVIGGFIIILVMAAHHRQRTGHWSFGDGF